MISPRLLIGSYKIESSKIVLCFVWMTFVFFVLYRFSQKIQFKRLFFVLGCVLLLVTIISFALTQIKQKEENQEPKEDSKVETKEEIKENSSTDEGEVKKKRKRVSKKSEE